MAIKNNISAHQHFFLASSPRDANFSKLLRPKYFGSCKTRSPDSVFVCVSVELLMLNLSCIAIGGCAAEQNDTLGMGIKKSHIICQGKGYNLKEGRARVCYLTPRVKELSTCAHIHEDSNKDTHDPLVKGRASDLRRS
jgi:hypothetical protein